MTDTPPQNTKKVCPWCDATFDTYQELINHGNSDHADKQGQG